jgi:hypothetical protein
MCNGHEASRTIMKHPMREPTVLDLELQRNFEAVRMSLRQLFLIALRDL